MQKGNRRASTEWYRRTILLADLTEKTANDSFDRLLRACLSSFASDYCANQGFNTKIALILPNACSTMKDASWQDCTTAIGTISAILSSSDFSHLKSEGNLIGNRLARLLSEVTSSIESLAIIDVIWIVSGSVLPEHFKHSEDFADFWDNMRNISRSSLGSVRMVCDTSMTLSPTIVCWQSRLMADVVAVGEYVDGPTGTRHLSEADSQRIFAPNLLWHTPLIFSPNSDFGLKNSGSHVRARLMFLPGSTAPGLDNKASRKMSFHGMQIHVLKRFRGGIPPILYDGEGWILDAMPGHSSYEAVQEFFHSSLQGPLDMVLCLLEPIQSKKNVLLQGNSAEVRSEKEARYAILRQSLSDKGKVLLACLRFDGDRCDSVSAYFLEALHFAPNEDDVRNTFQSELSNLASTTNCNNPNFFDSVGCPTKLENILFHNIYTAPIHDRRFSAIRTSMAASRAVNTDQTYECLTQQEHVCAISAQHCENVPEFQQSDDTAASVPVIDSGCEAATPNEVSGSTESRQLLRCQSSPTSKQASSGRKPFQNCLQENLHIVGTPTRRPTPVTKRLGRDSSISGSKGGSELLTDSLFPTPTTEKKIDANGRTCFDLQKHCHSLPTIPDVDQEYARESVKRFFPFEEEGGLYVRSFTSQGRRELRPTGTSSFQMPINLGNHSGWSMVKIGAINEEITSHVAAMDQRADSLIGLDFAKKIRRIGNSPDFSYVSRAKLRTATHFDYSPPKKEHAPPPLRGEVERVSSDQIEEICDTPDAPAEEAKSFHSQLFSTIHELSAERSMQWRMEAVEYRDLPEESNISICKVPRNLSYELGSLFSTTGGLDVKERIHDPTLQRKKDKKLSNRTNDISIGKAKAKGARNIFFPVGSDRIASARGRSFLDAITAPSNERSGIKAQHARRGVRQRCDSDEGSDSKRKQHLSNSKKYEREEKMGTTKSCPRLTQGKLPEGMSELEKRNLLLQLMDGMPPDELNLLRLKAQAI